MRLSTSTFRPLVLALAVLVITAGLAEANPPRRRVAPPVVYYPPRPVYPPGVYVYPQITTTPSYYYSYPYAYPYYDAYYGPRGGIWYSSPQPGYYLWFRIR